MLILPASTDLLKTVLEKPVKYYQMDGVLWLNVSFPVGSRAIITSEQKGSLFKLFFS